MYMYHIIQKCNTNTKYTVAVRISSTTTVTKDVSGKRSQSQGPGVWTCSLNSEATMAED